MSRDQIVRDTAYAIWEAEGKPDGRDAAHWSQAEARVAASLKGAEAKTKTGADAKAKPPAKGKVATPAETAPVPKPPAKAAATKAAPKKKS